MDAIANLLENHSYVLKFKILQQAVQNVNG